MTPQSAAPSVQLSRFGWRDLGLWTAAFNFQPHAAADFHLTRFEELLAIASNPPASAGPMCPSPLADDVSRGSPGPVMIGCGRGTLNTVSADVSSTGVRPDRPLRSNFASPTAL